MSDRTEIGNAIIAGIASGDTALEQMSEIVSHLERAGFVIVPREPTEDMDAAARAECHRMAGCLDPVIHIWDVMIDQALAEPGPRRPAGTADKYDVPRAEE